MNIQVRGAVSTPTKASGGNDLVGTNSASILGGEILIFGGSQPTGGPTFTTPTNWTAAITAVGQGGNTTNEKTFFYVKQAVLADASTTVTVHSNSTVAMSGVLFALYDADGGTLSITQDGTAQSLSTGVDANTFSTPSGLTTSLANSLVVFVNGIGKTSGATFTIPGGSPTITEMGQIIQGSGASEVAIMIQAAAGAVAQRTYTLSGNFDTVTSIVAAFTYTPPASSGAGALVGRQPISTMTEGRLAH